MQRVSVPAYVHVDGVHARASFISPKTGPMQAAGAPRTVDAVNAVQPTPPKGWTQLGLGLYRVARPDGSHETRFGIPPLSGAEEALRVRQAPAVRAALESSLRLADPAVRKAFNRLRDRMEACKDAGRDRHRLFATKEGARWLKGLSDPLTTRQREEVGRLLQMMATCSTCAHRGLFLGDLLFVSLLWGQMYGRKGVQ